MSCPDPVLSLSHPATFDALPGSKEPTSDEKNPEMAEVKQERIHLHLGC